jgi:hypothetical protein
MAIDDNINQVKLALRAEREALQNDPAAPTPVANNLRAKAEAAVHGGVVAYVEYMRLFATNAEELARLLPLEQPIDDERQKARAYLVRNGVCTMGTGEMLGDNVLGRLGP